MVNPGYYTNNSTPIILFPVVDILFYFSFEVDHQDCNQYLSSTEKLEAELSISYYMPLFFIFCRFSAIIYNQSL